MAFNRIPQILKLQKRNTQQLIAGVALILKDLDDEDDLLSKMPSISKELQSSINGIRSNAAELADNHSEQHNKAENDRKLIVAAVAVRLLGRLASSIAFSDKPYSEAVQEALETNKPAIKRIATTETFQAYNHQYIANHRDLRGYYLFNAYLDSRTCGECEELDGTKYYAEDAILQEPPIHSNCRCLLDFIYT